MITRASKLFFGLGAAAWLIGVLYGVITNGLGGVVNVISGPGAVDALLGPLTFGYKGGVGDHLGYSLLMGFAVCSLGMGAASSAFRDGNPEALAELAHSDAVPPVSEPNDLSQWPIVAAFGAMLMTLGLATEPILFQIGCVVVVIAAFEWMIKDWSERATGDAEVNRTIRNRMMYPVELPVAGLILVGIVVYCFSRLLLTVSKSGAVVAASVVGVLIFAVAVFIGTRPQIRRGLVVAAVLIGAVVVLAVGIFGAVRGEHEGEHTEEHGSALTSGGVDYFGGLAVGETE